MKNTEYRKGNLVEVSIYYDTDEAKADLGDDYSEENEWVVAKIASIENDLSEYDLSFETADGEYNRVREIPISKEWLVRFKFDSWVSENSAQIGEYVVYFSPFFKSCYFLFRKNRIAIGEIQYIHELQNLIFALTGKELELKKEVVS